MQVLSEVIYISTYQPALIVLSLLCLMLLIQSFLTAPLAFIKGEQSPGMPLKGDHKRLSFRVLRTHQNSVETLAPFGFIVLLAMLAEAHTATINWAAVLHLIFRLLFWVVYYSGVGKVAGGLRTLCFVGALISNIVMVTAVLVSLFQMQ